MTETTLSFESLDCIWNRDFQSIEYSNSLCSDDCDLKIIKKIFNAVGFRE